MGEKLRKFQPRAPRYVLRPQDRNVMRFGLHEGKYSTVQETRLLNLSESGIAFLTDSSQSFQLGDQIMVEIPIPDGEQIAWWAHIVRLQTYESRWWSKRDKFFDSPRTLVAAKFDKLPDGHSSAIRKGIERSFMKAMRDQRYRTYLYYKMYILENFLRWCAFAALCVLFFGLMYYWTRPSSNYDADKGAPWGERFK